MDKKMRLRKFLSTAKGKIIIVTAFVGGMAALIGNIGTIVGFFSGLFAPSRVDIRGIVLNSDSTSANKAHISITLYKDQSSDSMITISDDEGRFSFKNLKENKYDSFAMNISWKNKTVSYKNEFSGLVFNKDIVVRLLNSVLPETQNPLSFSYYNLRGNVIDYLLEGKVAADWEVKLSKHPYIITNEIFKTINELRQEFKVRSEPIGAEGIPTPVYIEKNGKQNQVNPNQIPAYYMIHNTEDPNETISIAENEVSLFVKEEEKQKLKRLKYPDHIYKWFPDRAGLLDIKKAEEKIIKLSGENVAERRSKLLAFLVKITENHYPDNFIEASLYYSDDPCTDGWFIEIAPPTFSLKIVLVENPTSQTLTLGKFNIKKNTGERKLNTASPDLTSELVSYNYFPKAKLKQNETIVLPLQFTFETSQQKQFAYGPSQLLESVEIDQEFYAVRDENMENIFMYDGSAGIGSCPYIYTFSESENDWLLEDHILYGINNKLKENEDMLPLSRFTGQLQIRENDPETSYIDYLYILHTLPDGKTIMLKPFNAELKEKDGNYLVLNTGDRIQLNFPKEEITEGKYLVIAYGYYIPRKLSPKYLSKR